MKSIDKIPTSKIERAAQLVKTGAKVGGNYLKYYASRISKTKEQASEELNKDNAEDIYEGLKTLKGSALKVAQMMSMDKSVLPQAYVEKFSLSQFSVPPLSGPLITKTFKKYFGKSPYDLYDEFNPDSINAASIGQVHQAKKGGKDLAVKIQYPGVADSIASDLALVKPFALKLLNISGKDAEVYFQEVKNKLVEETDYLNELNQGKTMAEACKKLPRVKFPDYYPELSCEKIITMDYMRGEHLSEFCASKAGSELSQEISQILWDFYMYQLHVLKKVHADPHPGNFLVDSAGELNVLDFGCLKEIPLSFYGPYFELTRREVLEDSAKFLDLLEELEVISQEDTPKDLEFIESIFRELLTVFTQPFHAEEFDFSDPAFYQQLLDLGERLSKDPQLRKQNGARGSKHFIYMNRTFFGLYNMMFDLKGNAVKIHQYKKYL